MRLGIVSDTHNNLKNCRRIVELFNDAEIDRVIHTGDITQAKTIAVFGALEMPMSGVFGNNDQERVALEAAMHAYGFDFHDPPWQVVIGQRTLCVVHDPLEFPEEALACDLNLHGHTHRYRCERRQGRLTFNPGECAGMMTGLNAIGVVDLHSLTAEVIKF